MAFRAENSPIGDFLIRNRGATVHVAGSLASNYWNGSRGIQFRISDLALA